MHRQIGPNYVIGIHGPPSWSKFLKRDAVIHGPQNWSGFLKLDTEIHRPPNRSVFEMFFSITIGGEMRQENFIRISNEAV